jgi:hypothetical protein
VIYYDRLAQGSWIVAWMEDSKRTVNYRLRNSELALIRRQKAQDAPEPIYARDKTKSH